jgi:hypothetical protein
MTAGVPGATRAVVTVAEGAVAMVAAVVGAAAGARVLPVAAVVTVG